MVLPDKTVAGNFAVTSSIEGDVRHTSDSGAAYEWWYFDALSDDGREALVVIFMDNLIFSPRYNKANPGSISDSKPARFPALAITYYRDGKPVYRAINEYAPSEFLACTEIPFCRIGKNEMSFTEAPYGKGYAIDLDLPLPQKKRITANLEWLQVEGDFHPEQKTDSDDTHNWNLVLSRADVTGRIEISNERGQPLDTLNFRGTGYHDHNYDSRWMLAAIAEWQWGRAHFADSTAVFYRYVDAITQDSVTKLVVVKDDEMRVFEASFEAQNFARDRFGLKYPRRMQFEAKNNIRLRVKQTKVIDSSFFYLRMMGEATLTLRDGKPRRMPVMTEYLNPTALKFRWLDWMIDMRIGRNGRAALLA